MTNGISALASFKNGRKWSQVYARKSLPVLVRWAEIEKARAEGTIVEYTYSQLAATLGQPSHAHPIHEALGVLGYALKELEQSKTGKSLGKIPPIQLLVWSKGKGSPGEDAFGFLGFTREQRESLPQEARRALARDARNEIIGYPHWRDVLAVLGLQPLTVGLPDPESVIRAPGFGGFGAGEGDLHKRLKHFLGEHYQLLGIAGQFRADFERKLLSGDVADLLLDEEDGPRRVCVEVKSIISDESDLIRGLFQCVKYEAVLDAHETYDLARNTNCSPRRIEVVLATEGPLPDSLRDLGKRLGVRIVSRIVVPGDYVVPAGAI